MNCYRHSYFQDLPYRFLIYGFPCSFSLSRHPKNLFLFSFRKMVPNSVYLLAIFLQTQKDPTGTNKLLVVISGTVVTRMDN